jgi:hypothetical protein
MYYKNVRTDVEYGGNSFIQKKERERLMKHHRERIRNMKSALDMKSPEDQPHLTTYGRNYFAKKKQTTEAAFNDLKMIQAIAKTMTRPFPYEENKEATVPHSLNRDWRKRELFRITMENHKLLDRLENLKPTASVKKLEEDYQKNQKYVVNSSWTARRARLYDVVDEGPPMHGIPNSASAPDLQDPYADGKLPPINMSGGGH